MAVLQASMTYVEIFIIAGTGLQYSGIMPFPVLLPIKGNTVCMKQIISNITRQFSGSSYIIYISVKPLPQYVLTIIQVTCITNAHRSTKISEFYFSLPFLFNCYSNTHEVQYL